MKVMLAAKAPPLDQLNYPVLASPKIDGIRAYVEKGVVMSRNNKPIPSEAVQALFGDKKLNGLDGELVAGPPNHSEAFSRTTSAVMTRKPKPGSNPHFRVQFLVFDAYMPGAPFGLRLKSAAAQARVWGSGTRNAACQAVAHALVKDAAGLAAYEQRCLAEGYEGVMVRDPAGLYKQGRSTVAEGGLLKVKQFLDAEATIIGFEEQMHNDNPRGDDGKRSTHKAGKLPMGVLGAFKVRTKDGVEFDVGSGFTLKERGEYWVRRPQLLGKLIRYRYFPTGTAERPRFPTFAGFRDRRDA